MKILSFLESQSGRGTGSMQWERVKTKRLKGSSEEQNGVRPVPSALLQKKNFSPIKSCVCKSGFKTLLPEV
jgi:hypothetical protein